VCRAPATRKISASTRELVSPTAAGGSAIGLAAGLTLGAGFLLVGGKKYATEVPHCDAHADGAALQVRSDDAVHILFRSYRYCREFAELNLTRPG
jgi:hypothetical protein